jgi:arylsulfatase A-like enzyme
MARQYSAFRSDRPARKPILLVLGILFSFACGSDSPPNVLLITVDTLRADHLGAYDSHASTPRVDAFAREATVFERVAAPMPLTRPSHFSLLTSLYPREHGALNNAASLPESATSLAEILSEQGYRTSAVVGVALLCRDSGAAQGFEFFDCPSEARERSAEEVVRRSLAWLEGLRDDERFFLWVHLFDPHLPYAPPPEYRQDSSSDGPEMGWPWLKQVAANNNGNIPAAVLERAKSLYRGEVAYTDHWIGELLSGLSSQRDAANTLVVLTADHGECFENGVYFEHADCMWEPAVRIPLIVRYPRAFPPGTRVPAQASIIDIAPTVLRAAGLDLPEEFSGRPLQEHETFGDRHVLIQYPFYQQAAAMNRPRKMQIIRSVAGEPTREILVDQEMVGLVGRDWKYLRTGTSDELFRLSPAPDERQNRIAEQREIGDEMKIRLDRLLERHPLNIGEPDVINEELRETLESLGYLN